jgi:hypothetical protein
MEGGRSHKNQLFINILTVQVPIQKLDITCQLDMSFLPGPCPAGGAPKSIAHGVVVSIPWGAKPGEGSSSSSWCREYTATSLAVFR